MQIELSTSDATFDALHHLADGRKATVKVDRQQLLDLLMDHTKMCNALSQRGCTIKGPRLRVRLQV